jgi:hypothetical protein
MHYKPLFQSCPIQEMKVFCRPGHNVVCPWFVSKIVKLRQLWGSLAQISNPENLSMKDRFNPVVY